MLYRQLALTLLLVVPFWYLYARVRGQEFLRWWGLAWTSFGAYLVITALVLHLAPEWTPLKSSLVLFSVLARFLQILLLVFATWSMRLEELRLRRWLKPGIGVALIAGTLSFAASYTYRDQPAISFSLRSVPHALGLAAASLFYAFSFFERWLRNRSSAATALVGISCLFYALDQGFYSADYIYGLIAGPKALRELFTLPLLPAGVVLSQSFDFPLFVHPAVIFLEQLSSCGICLGMMLLVLEEHQQAEQKLRGLSSHLVRAQEEERTRIARDLHDDVGQRLGLLAMQLETLKASSLKSKSWDLQKIDELSKLTSQISTDVRKVSHGLHPALLDLLGLTAAMAEFCKEFSRLNEIEIDFVHREVPPMLPKEVTLCLYRVAQEAVRNAQKHSGCRQVRVELTGASDSIRLRVSDSGEGFEPGSAQADRLGLVSMAERVQSLGGDLLVQSRPGCGTSVEARVLLAARLNEEWKASKQASGG
jgi:signal transduction histidine kinase